MAKHKRKKSHSQSQSQSQEIQVKKTLKQYRKWTNDELTQVLNYLKDSVKRATNLRFVIQLL